MNRLIIIARYWNDIDWVEASLEQIRYWNPDFVCLCEGCWDLGKPPRSIDGTRDILLEASNTFECALLDNLRDSPNYKENQAATSNEALRLARAKPGDWVMTVDCDHYYFRRDIDAVKLQMAIGLEYDYAVYITLNFNTALDRCYPYEDSTRSMLPYKLHPGAKFIPTCELTINGKFYRDIPGMIAWDTRMNGLHYETLRRPASRLMAKYSVGTRKSPYDWKDGLKIKNQMPYSGPHSEFAVPVLKKMGFDIPG